MIKAELKPRRYKTAKCWYGLYGGHYNVIVFFKKKPTHYVDYRTVPNCLDLLEESAHKNILGSMYLEDFLEMSGLDRNDFIPEDIEIVKVHRIEVTFPADEYGDMETHQFNVDGWQN